MSPSNLTMYTHLVYSGDLTLDAVVLGAGASRALVSRHVHAHHVLTSGQELQEKGKLTEIKKRCFHDGKRDPTCFSSKMRHLDERQPHVFGGGEAVQQQQRRRGAPWWPAAAVTEAVAPAVRVADRQAQPATPEPTKNKKENYGTSVQCFLLLWE